MTGSCGSSDVLVIMDDLPTESAVGSARRGLSVVAALNALAALGGGVALMTGTIELGAVLNERLPFASPVSAGIALVVIVAVPLTVVAWAAWAGWPRAGDAALVAGLLLVGWIVVQVAVLRAFSLFQPVYLGVAAYLIAASGRVRLGPGPRGALLVVAGAVAIAGGTGLVPHLVEGGFSAMSVWAIVLAVAGVAGVAVGTRAVWHGARLLGKVSGIVVTLLVVAATVWLIAPAVAATHVPATTVTTTPAKLGLTYESVTVTTHDHVRLAGWYLPSRNHAAVVLAHGAGSTRSDVLGQAGALSRAGYGVLLIDARGHGMSGGTAMDFGWDGDDDVAAGVDFLSARPEVDAARIGVVGFSMGGEEAVGAAGADRRIAAVVAEGATGRQGADKGWYSDVYGWRGWLQEQFEKVQTGITAYVSGTAPPASLRSAVEASGHTRFLLITAGNVPDEVHAAAALQTAAPDRVATWNIDGADHTSGYRGQPDRWRRRVLDFLDQHLRDVP